MKKKNLMKLMAMSLLTTSLFMLNPTRTEAAWIQDNTGWWFTEGNSWASNGWRYINGNWYYFNEAGYMAENTTIDGYYVDAAGKWIPSYVPAAANTVVAGDIQTGTGTEAYIGEEKAKEIAFNHAGVTADSAEYVTVKQDTENGIKTYEVDFISGEMEYDYEINAVTGEIISSDKEYKDSESISGSGAGSSSGNGAGTGSGSTSGSTESSDIGKEKAKEIAFEHAGVSADSVYALRVKADYEDNNKVYEINFKNDKVKYEYEINAATGEIVSSDKEYTGAASSGNGNGNSNGSGSSSGNGTGTGSGSTSGSTESSDIGKERAKEIAFEHAGVTADSVSSLKVKTDYENKVKVYEVEFKSGDMEYEYEINASTGAVESYDSEYDD